MAMTARVLLSLLMLVALLFSGFGFVTTFEPLPASQQWTWRMIYGLIDAGCLAGLWRLWFRRAR